MRGTRKDHAFERVALASTITATATLRISRPAELPLAATATALSTPTASHRRSRVLWKRNSDAISATPRKALPALALTKNAPDFSGSRTLLGLSSNNAASVRGFTNSCARSDCSQSISAAGRMRK